TSCRHTTRLRSTYLNEIEWVWSSYKGSCTSNLSFGERDETASGVALPSHESKSFRAAFLRSSALFLAAVLSLGKVFQRLRSSIFGTTTIGGVSFAFPSIAFCVVLLKQAEC